MKSKNQILSAYDVDGNLMWFEVHDVGWQPYQYYVKSFQHAGFRLVPMHWFHKTYELKRHD